MEQNSSPLRQENNRIEVNYITSPFPRLLVSEHVVCERLSAMQRLPEFGLANILLKIPWVPPLKYFRIVGLDHHRPSHPPPLEK